MKEAIKIFFLLVTISTSGYAQNLISNGSFESYNSLNGVIGTSDITFPSVKDWWSPTSLGTPNYLNTNSTFSPCLIPKSMWAYQYPHFGNSYVGLYLFAANTPNEREYIETKLLQPLVQGKSYFVKFYVSLYDSLPGGFCFFFSYKKITAISGLGAYFSNTKIDTATDGVVNRIPQIKATTFLTDTAGWMEVSGYYTAHGGEQYLTIGNFYDDAHTPMQTVLNTPGGIAASYYIIDDVSVEDASGVGQLVVGKVQLTIYPNPTDNTTTISLSKTISNATIRLVTVTGQTVLEKINQSGNQFTIALSNQAQGIYFVEVIQEGNVWRGKVVKE